MSEQFRERLTSVGEPKESSRSKREKQEIIVVGGSAAGLYTAAKLARGGRAVRVLDSKPELDPAPRSLIVTHHFRKLLGPAAAASVRNEIRRFELFTDGRSAQIALRDPDLIIERAKLIPALAAEGQNHGAQKEELHADHVIGADGATSRVARAAGWPPVETVPLVQAIVNLPKDCPPDTTRVWFVPDDTPYFYWLIPENESRGALGIIGEGSGQETKRRIEKFLEKKGMTALEWQGARIPVYRKWVPVRRKIGNGEVFLVGDAAAQVKVSTVGGIVTGFRGAQGVADALLEDAGSTELRSLRRELGTHWLIRRALHYFQQKDYSQLVDLLNDSTRESLGEINRDESTKLLWNVIRRQPRLVLMGLRGLLMGKPAQ